MFWWLKKAPLVGRLFVRGSTKHASTAATRPRTVTRAATVTARSESFKSQALITFVDKGAEYGNLGDYLSSPRHYFTFEARDKLAVIGGGAWNDFAVQEAETRGFPYDRSVVWGV